MSRLLQASLLALLGCRSQLPPPANAASRTHAPLTFTWLGVSGWVISDGVRTVLVDPYYSRPADPFDHPVSDPAAIAAHAPPRADLIVIGHDHVDHALDAPAVTASTGATLLAAPTVLTRARDAGIADNRLLLAIPGEDYQLAEGLSVRVIRSLHSAIGFSNGADVATFAYLLRFGHARAEVLVLDTANFDESALAGVHPDVAIVATGLRSRIHNYACRLMTVLDRPSVVFANHFDDWRAAAGTALDRETQVDLEAFTREIHACAPQTRVRVPTAFVGVSE